MFVVQPNWGEVRSINWRAQRTGAPWAREMGFGMLGASGLEVDSLVCDVWGAGVRQLDRILEASGMFDMFFDCKRQMAANSIWPFGQYQ